MVHGRYAERLLRGPRLAPRAVESKHRVIADRLASRVRRGFYRGKIPGVRALGEEFGVNFKTANRAVDALAAAGLVERRLGRGTYVVKETQVERTRLALAFYKFGLERPDPIFAGLFASANSAARQAGCRLELSMPDIPRAPEGVSKERLIEFHQAKFLDEIAESEPEGILYCGNANERVFRELNLMAPVIQVTKFGFELENYVRRDPGDGVARAVHSLARSGRRRIAYAHYGAAGAEREEKIAAYRIAVEELGLGFRSDISVEYMARPEIAAELLKERADGVVCGESTIGQAVLTGLIQRGVNVPHDTAVWSFDDGGTGDFMVPRMSAIRVFDEEVGKLAVARLVEIVEGRTATPHCETLPGVLVERESSGGGLPLE